MSEGKSWQAIVASSLDWNQAHTTLEDALKGLTRAGRSTRPKDFPHSVWQFVEHIRIAQHDLLDFLTDPAYSHDLHWPDDYWPKDPAPATDEIWETSIEQLKHDRDAMKAFAMSSEVDLAASIPHGSGQTYLRTILVAVDHAAYHLGQIVTLRRLNGDWPA